MKVVKTVTGPIPPEDLGITLTHEHTFSDQTCYRNPMPEELTKRAFLESPVSLQNLGKIRYNMHQHQDNIKNVDKDAVISEMLKFKYAGGKSICDATTYGIGRDSKAIREVSYATGLNIILGCGIYVEQSLPDFLRDYSRTALIDLFIREATEGDQHGVVSGFIGELGCSKITPKTTECLEIGAEVQKATGLSIMVHPPFFEKEGHKVLDILEKAGANMERVVFAHIDPQCEDDDYIDSLMKRGVFVEYDQFLHDFPCTLENYVRKWLPSDYDRVRSISRQIQRGNVKQILLSQDICFKVQQTRWGGQGYAHLLENMVPTMLDEGISRDDIRTMFVDNPRRMLEVAQ